MKFWLRPTGHFPPTRSWRRCESVIQFTDRELSTNSSGQERWRTAANAALSRRTFGGWLERDDGAYSLTESGAEALEQLSADDLWLEISRRYQASKREGESQGVGWEPFLLWARELTASST